MLVDQAIFTSIRSGRNEGYQLAAATTGISADEQRDLAQWGPGHDSLYDNLPTGESVNFHRMASGRFCLSLSVYGGREYSGRGGQRIYTHMIVVAEELLCKFGGHPFRMLESLLISGRVVVPQDKIPALEPLMVVGRGSWINEKNLEHVAGKLGTHRLAALVNAALNVPTLGITSPVSGKRLLSALLDLLPPAHRLTYPFTTGLRVSAVRDYRWAILPADAEEQRRAIRQVHLEMTDLTKEPPARFAPNRGWPQLIFQLLRRRQYATLKEVIAVAAQSDETDADLLAEQLREQLEKATVPDSLSLFPG